MELIVLSTEHCFAGEAGLINDLLGAGLTRFHLRKKAGEAEVGGLLAEIEPAYYKRISVHQYHATAWAAGVGGIHYTGRQRAAVRPGELEGWRQRGAVLSTSAHVGEDVAPLVARFDYTFYGPVFDSISKQGYKAGVLPDFRLPRYNGGGAVIALGGIHAGNVGLVADMGFGGVAVLGGIWERPANAVSVFSEVQVLCAHYSSFKAGYCD